MVPTSAGTGAEATPNSIVVLPEKKLKVGVVHPAFLPQNVILDPQLARSLPPAVTAATGLDAFCHCIETYISKKACPFSRLFSLKGLELICKYLRRAYHDGQDMEAREGMLLAAFYGGVAITASRDVYKRQGGSAGGARIYPRVTTGGVQPGDEKKGPFCDRDRRPSV